MNVRQIVAAGSLLAVAACSGGGGAGSAPPASNGGGSTTPQSSYVTPKFVLTFPEPGTSANERAPQFLGSSSKGVTITLVSSTAGLSNVAVSTDLTANGVCSGSPKSCTVSGPPVPPGTDVFSVATYNLSPTGSPLAEPANAIALAQTSTTATPASGNPSFTIVAGTSPTLTIALYGIPAAATLTTLTGTPDTPFASPKSLGLVVSDFAGDAITGEFSKPVTLSDSDTSGAQGSQLNISGGTAGATQTLNSATDATSATLNYGGLAIASPTITVSAGTTLGSAPFTVAASSIKLTPSEIDLFNVNAGATGNFGTFTAAEAGWTDNPYSKSLTLTPGTCSSGTAATVYSLSALSGTSFTDTVPASPAAGVCSVTAGGDLQGNTAVETLTFTTAGFTINDRGRGTR